MMKYVYTLFIAFVLSLNSLTAHAYEPQGTTIIKDSCHVRLILQIGVETDSIADINYLQTVLNECFALECDLPCVDRRTGFCKIFSKVVIVNWSDLGAADKPKFHHVKMLNGNGVSTVSEILKPNSGKSTSGHWFRRGYSPKIFCHEAMHLCGLDDHYRDCRADRLASGVDNCKDNDTCTAEQKRNGECPPCKGYEDDIMGNDVTKPIDCNRDIVELLRILNDPNFVCSEECCAEKIKPRTRTPRNPTSEFGLIVDGGLGYYPMQNELMKNDKLKLIGLNFSFGFNVMILLCNHFMLDAYTKLNFASLADTRTTTQNNYSTTQNFKYHFTQSSLGTNIGYKFNEKLSTYAGLEFGAILSAKSSTSGTYNYNGMSTPFGSDKFEKITEKKNLQFGMNIGAKHNFIAGKIGINPFINMYIPFTNQIAFTSLTNKYYRFNIGAIVNFHRAKI